MPNQNKKPVLDLIGGSKKRAAAEPTPAPAQEAPRKKAEALDLLTPQRKRAPKPQPAPAAQPAPAPAPAPAPTPAAPAPKAEKKGWICSVCGYIYEGEELPDDFICPTCKHPAADFKKL